MRFVRGKPYERSADGGWPWRAGRGVAGWPRGGGELGALIRAHDWAATPLGPLERWPQSLRVAVRLILTTRHPMLIWWGPALIQLYNDAYRATMGPEQHPAALGGRGRATWDASWDRIGPQIAQVMAGRGATWHEDQLVPVTRHGRREEVWWTYGYSPIDDAAAPSGVGGVLVVCRDVTAEQHRTAALREAQAAAAAAVGMRDAFLAIATHELRTPVTTLRGTAQLLRRLRERGRADEARLDRALATIERSAERLGALLDDLLDVTRLQGDRLPLAVQPTDLAALVAAAVAAARARAGARHDLTVAAPGDLPAIPLDAARIEQVLVNLLDNAVKYSPAGGTVTVTLAPAGAGLAVTVRDQGIGLPPGAAEAIFAPFGRAANAAARHLPGLGLGLVICRGIVEQHGGQIRAASAGEGRGTTVTFWLPLAGPPERQRGDPDQA